MLLLVDFLLISGFTIISVNTAMLWLSEKRRLPQNILLVILGFISITIIGFYAELHRIKLLHIFSLIFEDGQRLLLGPLLFIYVKSLFLKQKNLLFSNYMHFVPFLIYWFVNTLPSVFSAYQGQLAFDYLEAFQSRPYLFFVQDLFLIVYIALSIRLFYRLKGIIRSNFSSYLTNDVSWLKKFLFCCFGLISFDLLITFYEVLFGYFVNWDTGYITIVILIFLVSYLGYHGIKQSVVSLPDFILEESSGIAKVKSGSNMVLTNEEAKDLSKKLEEVLADQKPYLLPDITLVHLAKLVGTTDKKLSTLLNQGLKTSFYDFINKHRVQTVTEKLKSTEYDKFSMLGIAHDSGFNSKSSFYRAFKKETGVSPVEYKKKPSI